jgi:hypothetical protein
VARARRDEANGRGIRLSSGFDGPKFSHLCHHKISL